MSDFGWLELGKSTSFSEPAIFGIASGREWSRRDLPILTSPEPDSQLSLDL
jgi:hypothetical protein